MFETMFEVVFVLAWYGAYGFALALPLALCLLPLVAVRWYMRAYRPLIVDLGLPAARATPRGRAVPRFPARSRASTQEV